MQNEILIAFEQQTHCYRLLAKMADIQHQHVQHNRTEALLELLKDRQALVDQISAHEQIVGPAKRDWVMYAAKLDAASRTRAEAMLSESRDLLERITASDQHDALVLQQRKLSLGKQISQTGAANRVNRNYAVSAYGKNASSMDVQH